MTTEERTPKAGTGSDNNLKKLEVEVYCLAKPPSHDDHQGVIEKSSLDGRAQDMRQGNVHLVVLLLTKC